MTKESDAQQKIERARTENVKKTLESKLIQHSVGANLIKSQQGDFGKLAVDSANSLYQQSMFSEEATNAKSQLYDEKMNEGKQLGVAGEPNITNYDLSLKLAKQLEEVMGIAKLHELEEYAKNVGAKLDFELPEELKNFSRAELINKIIKKSGPDFDGRLDLNKLDSETERDALMMYESLSHLYKRACAFNVSQSHYFNDLNETGKAIASKYKKAEEQK